MDDSMSENEPGILGSFAQNLGAPEAALRLILSLLSGYPLALVHRYFFYGKSANIQHVFFIVCGLGLCYFNFGSHAIHSVINVLLIYVVLLIFGGTTQAVIISFVINMVYLCWGYYSTMTGNYTIRWTTPHCVLTLRLIGLVFDVYDGKRKRESLSNEQKETALAHVPSLLEVAGHIYFFGSFLVGPQFPMKRYKDFINGAYSDSVTGDKPACVAPGLKRLAAGIAYTVLYQVSSMFLPDSYLTSESFQEWSFIGRCFIILIWGKFTLYKYVGVWLMTEGSCIMCGLTYNGKDENGNDLWDACANIKIRNYERASTCHELILSFNINTNRWMAKYCFKRLKFLGNKDVSQGLTLFFLALWHGLYSGYFVNFFLEFLIIKFEKELGPLLWNMKFIQSLYQIPGFPVLAWTIKKTYALFALGYALVSFCLFTYDNYLHVYWSVYFVAHVCLISWVFVYPNIKPWFRDRRKPPQAGDTDGTVKKTD